MFSYDKNDLLHYNCVVVETSCDPHVGYWCEGKSKLLFPETPIIARDNK